jgi:hypothetical protein
MSAPRLAVTIIELSLPPSWPRQPKSLLSHLSCHISLIWVNAGKNACVICEHDLYRLWRFPSLAAEAGSLDLYGNNLIL